MAISSTPSDYNNEVAGRLVSKITTTATSGITVNPQDVNGAFITWPTGNQVLKLSRKTRTKTQVEYIAVDSATQDATTGVVTLGTTSRNLALTGASFTGTGTGIAFPSGTLVELVWGAHQADRTAFKDIANTFSATQTISGTNELRFADSATAIWDNGTSLSFKDSTTATKTLAELSAAGGSDEKVKVSINDTTGDYLLNKLAAGTGITLTETNNGGDEDVTIATVNTVATGHTGLSSVTSGGLLVGAGTSNMTIIGPGTSGQVPVSNGTTIAMGNAIPTGTVVASAMRSAPTGWLLCNGSAVSRSTYSDLFSAIVTTVGTVTVTINSPGVFTKTSHGLIAGDQVYFTTTGALPTGLSANTVYYVISTGLSADDFRVSTSLDGSAVNTSGSQSGTHTAMLCPFGVGDGSTTFNLPDIRGRFPAGSDTMGSTAATRMTVNSTALGDVGGVANAAHTHTISTTAVSSGGGGTGVSSGTSSSTNALPPYISLFYIIKT